MRNKKNFWIIATTQILLSACSLNMNAPITNYSLTFNDLNNVQLEAAKKKGIVPVKTNRSLKYEDHNLYIVQDCEYFGVDKLTYSHPYVTKNTAKLMVHIGQDFQKLLHKNGYRKHKIIITSVLRTDENIQALRQVNQNAVWNSAHRYATTFDITYIRFYRLSTEGKPASNQVLKETLGKVLRHLRKKGKCYVKYEVNQHCFHLTSRK